MRPSFTAFLLNEDLAADVLALQTQLSQLQAKKANATKPMDAQIQQITNQLAIKQKQLASEQKSRAPAAAPPPAPPAGGPTVNNAAAAAQGAAQGQTRSQ